VHRVAELKRRSVVVVCSHEARRKAWKISCKAEECIVCSPDESENVNLEESPVVVVDHVLAGKFYEREWLQQALARCDVFFVHPDPASVLPPATLAKFACEDMVFLTPGVAGRKKAEGLLAKASVRCKQENESGVVWDEMLPHECVKLVDGVLSRADWERRQSGEGSGDDDVKDADEDVKATLETVPRIAQGSVHSTTPKKGYMETWLHFTHNPSGGPNMETLYAECEQHLRTLMELIRPDVAIVDKTDAKAFYIYFHVRATQHVAFCTMLFDMVRQLKSRGFVQRGTVTV
jgi:hypothetical protein